ncbi:MAG: two-component system phosphate regulon sensor histidine kinase PhoR [Pseudohongiellaceae bacterium]
MNQLGRSLLLMSLLLVVLPAATAFTEGNDALDSSAGWWSAERVLLLALSLAGTGLLIQRLASGRRHLAAQVARNAGLLEALDEGLLGVDGSGNVILANSGARRFLGAVVDGPIGLPLVRVSTLPALATTIGQARTAGGRVFYETTVRENDDDRVLRIIASPIPGPEGLCIVAVRDLTEMRRLELVRRDFVSNVSHELKTPLTSMRGFVEAILEDPEMPADLRTHFLGKARHSTERLSAIVSDLLNLTRIESTAGQIEREPIELGLLVGDTVRAAAEDAEARVVSLAFAEPPAEATIWGDEQSVALAVSNLIDNAVKYSPEGGFVGVKLIPEGAWLTLSVDDEGPGVPVVERERIFERFYRVDKVRSRELGGTGLGLSIVKNVVLAHGGEVEVQSSESGGSRFLMRLPVSRGAEQDKG